MNQDNRQRNRNRSGKNPIGLIAIAAIILFNIASEGISSNPDIIAFIIGIAVIAAVVFAVIMLLKKGISAAKAGAAGFSKPERFTHNSKGRKAESPAPSYTGMNPDLDRRLRQLDSFLKNGIIDKSEYNILRNRYIQNGK